MKKFAIILLAVAAILPLSVSCQKVNDIDKRLSDLEQTVSNLKAQIAAGAVITSVDQAEEGYTIVLSNGQTYNVINGKDGMDGEAIIADVKIEEDFVVLTFKNGETLRISYQNPLSMVTLAIVPDNSDGSVNKIRRIENDVEGNPYYLFFVDVEVTPAKYAEILSDTGKYIHKAVFCPVKTKSSFHNSFTLSPASIAYMGDADIPFLATYFEVDEETAWLLEHEAYSVSYIIEDKDGIYGSSTAFVSISYEGDGGQDGEVDNWGEGVSQTVQVNGYKVTVKLSDDIPASNVISSVSVEGQSVKIIVCPIYNIKEGLICNISGTANCDRVKDDRYIHTFTISEIQSDIIATIEYVPLPSGALKGVFTVADDGNGNVKKVHFSQGNLYCSRPSAESDDWTWHFYSDQYGYNSFNEGCNEEGNRIISSDETEIDLFTWGYSDSTSLSPVGVGYVSSHQDEGETLVYNKTSSEGGDDWGVAYCESNNISPGTWHTLSEAEWRYLFACNSKGELDMTSPRYGLFRCGVNVCGKANCVVIAPDDWNLEAYPLQDSYDSETWPAAEEAGLVCLPAAGFRSNYAAVYVGSVGIYWSSSVYDDTLAFYVYIKPNEVDPKNTSLKGFAHSVRLVTECQPEDY